MEGATDTTRRFGERVRTPFAHILCGVDATEAGFEAVRQAGALAGPESTIELVAVTNERAGGAMLPKTRAIEALERAAAELCDSPADVVERTVTGRTPWRMLIDEAREHDLLVLGRHYKSRAGGVVMSSVVSHAVHSADLPVLVAVEPPRETRFPERIVVGANGPGHAADAVRVAARIASHADAELTVLRVDWAREARGPQLSEALVEAEEMTGVRPADVIVGGSPHRQIVEFARSERASLIVLGSRSLHGLPALHSVSERVAHEAPCSVLVARRGS